MSDVPIKTRIFFLNPENVMDPIGEGFRELSEEEYERLPLIGEIIRLMNESIEPELFKTTYIDNVYQKGDEFIFIMSEELDSYQIERHVSYYNRWDERDFCLDKRNLRQNLLNAGSITIPGHFERFYIRDVETRTKIWPSETMMNNS